MRYEIVFSPEAIQDLKRLSARDRSIIRDELEKHLRFEPDKLSKSRIKRLQGFKQPQYRLRIGDIRLFYDITGNAVMVLAIVRKSDTAAWLSEMGEAE